VDPEQPTPEDVRAQLERLLTSHVLASSVRLQRFLRHVVARSLAGEADQLKEYAIGVAVFDRDDRFDPRIDSIVRVEAGRLRTKIDEYYATAGAGDPVRIRVARGGYVARFERRERPVATVLPPAAAPPRRRWTVWRPALALAAVVTTLTVVLAWQNAAPRTTAQSSITVAVLPFASFSTVAADQMLAARLTDGVTNELVRLGTVAVISRTTALRLVAAGRPLKEVAQTLNVNLVVEGSVETDGDRIRIQPRLVDAGADRKGWIPSVDGRRADLPRLQQQIAEIIAREARQRLASQ
jgi:TolB-like protein